MEIARERFLRGVLETYTFEEILEDNDLELIDVLEVLHTNGLIDFYHTPVDYE